MSRTLQRIAWIVCLVGLCPFVSPAAAAPFDPYIGEVTTATLNVRSGPSENYYVVERLKAGDRVHVVNEENGWCAVIPPAGCYSLVPAEFVDLDGGGKRGIINGNAVRVRAGSALDRKKYAVQLKLDKGAEVIILGDDGEGYLRVAPPAGAHVWIHGDYLARVPTDRLAARSSQPAESISTPQTGETPSVDPQPSADEVAAPVAASTRNPVDDLPDYSFSPVDEEPVVASRVEESDPGTIEPAPVQPVGSAAVEPVAESRVAPRPSIAEATGAEITPLREKLREADAALKAEMEKPFFQRRMEPIIEQFQPLAEQETDLYSKLYAERRIEQMNALTEAIQAVEEVNNLASEVTDVRRNALQARSSRPYVTTETPRGFDAKGELRESMIYASTAGPKRFRLVDPSQSTTRTLCYVEIPDDVSIDVSSYLGRTVGIRARDKYLQTGDVDPIPVVVAEEIVVMGDVKATISSETADVYDVGNAERSVASTETGPLIIDMTGNPK